METKESGEYYSSQITAEANCSPGDFTGVFLNERLTNSHGNATILTAGSFVFPLRHSGKFPEFFPKKKILSLELKFERRPRTRPRERSRCWNRFRSPNERL